jgi:hypothetical protein
MEPGAPIADAVPALALWLVVLAPQWALLLWGVRSADRVREVVARSSGMKLLAAALWMAAVALAMIGTVFVCRDVLGPKRLELQHIVANATLVQEGLLVVFGILLLTRRRARGGPPAPVAPSARRIRRLLLGWVAAAVVLVGLAVGPFAGRAAAEHVWRALALAVVTMLMLLVFLALAIHHDRKGARRGSGEDE